MITSLDGRLHPHRWSDPVGGDMAALVDRTYEEAAGRLEADGWIVGRKTMVHCLGEGTADGGEVELLGTPQPRHPHVVPREGKALGVVIDPMGRLRHEQGEIAGDKRVAVLSERVSDAYLATLRAVGVSYVFAGPDGDDLDTALEMLKREFAVRHLLLEGGGMTNGAFLAAGLIDEVSTLICPAIDGLAGVSAIFEHIGGAEDRPSAGQHLELISCDVLAGGVVWTRHRVTRDRDTGAETLG